MCFFPLLKQTLFLSTVRWYTFEGRPWSYSVVCLSLCFCLAFAWGRFLWALRFSALQLYPLGSGLLHVEKHCHGNWLSCVVCCLHEKKQQKGNRNSGHRCLYNGLTKNWVEMFYTHCQELTKSSWWSWQLVIAIHDKADGLVLCDWHSKVMTLLILVMCSSLSCYLQTVVVESSAIS